MTSQEQSQIKEARAGGIEPAGLSPPNIVRSGGINSSYSALRTWYLARLRTPESDLTPATLVAADNEKVKFLIEQHMQQAAQAQQRRIPVVWKVILPITFWLFGLVGWIALLAFNCHDKIILSNAIFTLLIGVFIGQTPDALFENGLPAYFVIMPMFVIGLPVLWFSISFLWQQYLRSNGRKSN